MSVDQRAPALQGRIALITGGSRGIGRGIALELARAGADIAINYRRDAAAASEVRDAITAMGRRAVAVAASIDRPAEVAALVEAVEADLGQVDLLVASAGVASRGLSVSETDDEEFQRLIDVHALSVQRLVRHLVPAMRTKARADVVVISSSEVAHMRAQGGPYNMAKAALEALALTLAHEEAEHGIRVNIVAPGLVVTDMGDRLVRAKLGFDGAAELDQHQPFGRVCRPEDVAQAVRFLCSSEATMITGQRIVVDGGVDASPTAH